MKYNKKSTYWKVSPKEAVAMQKELRKKIKLVPLKKKIRHVGGCDVSMNLFATDGFVTLSFPTLDLIDHSVVKEKINFPYISGLLSFREIPMLLGAWEKLKKKPDVIIVDGAGIAHPRRLGIATHLGILLNVPTIGCAKSRLTGTYKEPKQEPGSFSYLYDTYNKTEIIGAVLRTKLRVKPLFISPGHLITLKESIEIIQKCVVKHRLPEATRLAHNTVNEYRVKDMGKKST
ncbi:MAG TPA: deoxyribonuclease V [Candidatus Paceibacterota bacterium]|jgi:deoxyribonuclease V|nr:deoxyribonuclease V [Candidatus Paceibacterota bacterium]